MKSTNFWDVTPSILIEVHLNTTPHSNRGRTDFLLNCCWSLPAQLFLVVSPTGITTIFYSLTALRSFSFSSGEELITYFPRYDTDRIVNDACCVCIRCCCLSTIGGVYKENHGEQLISSHGLCQRTGAKKLCNNWRLSNMTSKFWASNFILVSI
jgi:hypothetical protein